jgi:2-methylisocitrate lyase-like PEP mutase family enzyme
LIVDATDLPVSADLENGFGDAPQLVAETIRLAADAGLVGCTIEDTTGNQDRPLYDSSLAVERIAAAAQAAHALSIPFILTARAHNLMYANSSLDETIKRLQAFEGAAANVLFAPGLPDLSAVRAVCTAVSKPVNFVVGIKGKSFSVAELTEARLKRISLATSLYRAAMSGFLEAASEVKNSGQFLFVERCASTQELLNMMRMWLCRSPRCRFGNYTMCDAAASILSGFVFFSWDSATRLWAFRPASGRSPAGLGG